MNKRYKIITGILLGMVLLMSPMSTLVHAQETPQEEATGGSIPTIPKPELLPGPGEEQNQGTVQEYFREQTVPGFINGFIGLIAGLALISTIIGGLRFALAFGEEEKITAAKKTIIYGIVGFGVSILAYAIVSVVNTIAFPERDSTLEQSTDEDPIYDADSAEEVDYNNI